MGYFSWEVLSKKKSVAVGYGQRGNLSFCDRMKTLLKLIAAAWLAAAQEETVQVRLQQGVIEGARSEAAGGRFFYTFRSIPFAKPPVGELRFKVGAATPAVYCDIFVSVFFGIHFAGPSL